MTGRRLLAVFAAAAVGLGLARGLTTTYVPVLLDRIADSPALIGAVMLVNAVAGFVVPPIVGVLSDRRTARGVYILGGALLAAAGLILVALGNATGSFVPLTLAAAVTYVGLNSAATAHRALVPERFAAAIHARATSAQELAALVGALLATVAGGALVGGAPGLLFAAAAVPVVLFAIPTLAMARRGGRAVDRAEPAQATAPGMRPRELVAAAMRPGIREVLAAQVLWVLAYAAMPAFMVLYAEHVLDLSTAAAGGLLAAFGVLTAAGLLLGGRVPAQHVRTVLATGAALLGGGLLVAAPADTIATAAPGFATAAVGAGLVTSLGFAYFARFLPAGQEGRYSGLFLSTRAIASAVALPLGGGLIAVTGSYRSLLLLGAGALLALVPLLRAERTAPARAPRATPILRPLRRVVAVMPVYHSTRFEGVTRQTLQHVDAVVLVDDGAPGAIAARARALAQIPRVGLVELPSNGGKGTALAAGIRAALEVEPDAVLLLDSDGQHPANLIPEFLREAEHADVVVGNRRAARTNMPRLRRVANALSSSALSLAARQRLPDSQNGMRLIRTEVLRRTPHPDGRYEAETRHLKTMLGAGARVAWVPMPAIYDGEPSDFRPLADALRVGRAIVSSAAPGTHSRAVVHHVRDWGPRLAISAAFAWIVAAMLPLLQRTDEGILLTVNSWGDGPEWLYRALDPHSRNYILIALAGALGILVMKRARYVVGVVVAAALAAFVADALLELVQLGIDRPRPGEVLGNEITLTHGRSWDHIPSFPSGHLIVTAAMVTAVGSAVRWLRGPLIVYLVAVAFTRLTFGAHFPLDVLVGTVLGVEVGLFAVGAVRAAGLLPEAVRRTPVYRPAGALAGETEREERAIA